MDSAVLNIKMSQSALSASIILKIRKILTSDSPDN